MKTLSLKLDLTGIELSEADSKRSNIDFAVTIIKNIILNYASTGDRRGLTEEERRQYYKICDALDLAQKEKRDTVELEDSYMGFLRKCKRESTMIPNKLLQQVESLIEEVKDR